VGFTRQKRSRCASRKAARQRAKTATPPSIVARLKMALRQVNLFFLLTTASRCVVWLRTFIGA
jgi:hypothetical protein